MSGIFTRPAIDNILNDGELTPEQRREKIFSLYGRSLDEGYVSKSAAEEAKQAAVDAAKADFKVPDPIDPKTTPEYLAIVGERDMLRTIGGEDFASVKPKFREQAYGMLDRGENAPAIKEQLDGLREKWEEMFFPEKQQEEPKNTPQFSKQPGNASVNPESEEEKLAKQLSAQW